MTTQGLIVGGYICTKKVGGGISSSVYKAHSINTPSTVVAIKIIDRRELLKVSLHAEEYVRREISILQQLDHPNIVKLVEVLDNGTTIHLVMEFCKGGSLREYLDKQCKLGEAEVFKLMSQLVDALKYMFSKSVIHRDLKPHNILLTGDGAIKICDYGFARIYEKQKLMDSILGSPLYMAPEIFGSTKYTTKCDLWSLGIIMYEMLAGTVPYVTNSVVQLYSFYENSKRSGIQLPRPINDAVSSNCSALLGSLLRVLPEDRITWHDFFQHPFFYSSPVGNEVLSPASPLHTRLPATADGLVTILTVPRCDKLDINFYEIEATCQVKLFKLSLATKLQTDASCLSDSHTPMLMLCTGSEVTEMEDERQLSAYNNIFSRKQTTLDDNVRLLYVDVSQKHDHAGDVLHDNTLQYQVMEKIDSEDTSQVGNLVRDFKQFVSRQDYFYNVTEDRFGQCVKYIADRGVLLFTVQKSMTLLESALKKLRNISFPSIELFHHQEQSFAKISTALPARLQEMKAMVLHDTLKSTSCTTLLDFVGADNAMNLFAETEAKAKNCAYLVQVIKDLFASVAMEAQCVISCEETLKGLRNTQREAQQWVEGLKLYRDHTAKWASVVSQHKRDRGETAAGSSSNDVEDLEWSFVVDGLLEVRAGCAHDLDVAGKLMSRVDAHWQKCVSTRASMWEELSSRLQRVLDVRASVMMALHEVPLLGQQLLDQQTRIEKLNAIIELPEVYEAYLHAVYNHFVFENRSMHLLEIFNTMRKTQVSNLTRFQQLIDGSPFAPLFRQGVDLRTTAIACLQTIGSLSTHDVIGLSTNIDDEFDVVVPEEDAVELVHANAILKVEVRQLRESKLAQEVKLPVEQILALTAENEQLRNQMTSAKDGISHHTDELRELTGKYDELVCTLKERELEKGRERDEFSAKFAHSIEILRTQNRVQQGEFEAKVQRLQKELEESKKEVILARQREEKLGEGLKQATVAMHLAEGNKEAREQEQKIGGNLTTTHYFASEHIAAEDLRTLQRSLCEKDAALLSLQGALDESEGTCAELSDRIELLLKLHEEQIKVNHNLQQQLRLQKQQQQLQL